MTKKHIVIIIPGLGDQIKKVAWATKFWNRYKLTPIVFSMEWVKRGNNYQLRFKELLKLIDDNLNIGNKVSLVGTSAGSSVAINAFCARKSIYRVVNICGRLRTGPSIGYRSFKNMTKGHPGFAESVIVSEKNLNKISMEDRKKIMTTRPLFGDQLVPSETVIVEGAYNITVPMVEHTLGITMSLTLFSKPVISFLKS
ncbi:MAG TPA: hypothetical protein VKC53_02155 [Patescibacteria group bacterium]|nr:hypothetical protein [Patescibacteria group bacterium]